MGNRAVERKPPTFSYRPGEQILHVGFANLRLETEAEIDEVFRGVRQFWAAKCGGRKVYAVVDYTNFSLKLELTEYYARKVKEVVEQLTLTTVRYTNDFLVRTTLRVVGMTIHKPSNLYLTRADAIEVVRALRSNRMSLAP